MFLDQSFLAPVGKVNKLFINIQLSWHSTGRGSSTGLVLVGPTKVKALKSILFRTLSKNDVTKILVVSFFHFFLIFCTKKCLKNIF